MVKLCSTIRTITAIKTITTITTLEQHEDSHESQDTTVTPEPMKITSLTNIVEEKRKNSGLKKFVSLENEIGVFTTRNRRRAEGL